MNPIDNALSSHDPQVIVGMLVLCLLFALCMAVAACLLEGISYAIGRRWRRWRARRHQWLKPGALPPPQDSVLRTRRPIEADGHNVIQFKRRA